MFEVIDKIAGETLTFGNQFMAEREAEFRLSIHRNGYDIRRNHIPGCDAIMKIEGTRYIICLNTTKANN